MKMGMAVIGGTAACKIMMKASGKSGFSQTNKPQEHGRKENIFDQHKFADFSPVKTPSGGLILFEIVINVAAQYQHKERNGHGADHG